MRKSPKIIALVFVLLFSRTIVSAQLLIKGANNAAQLAQKLVGDGVIISNVSFTGNLLMAGLFDNIGGTHIGIESGMVLTCGRAKTFLPAKSVDGNGVTPAQQVKANNRRGQMVFFCP